MVPGMLTPMLKVAAAQLKARIAAEGEESVIVGLAQSANELLYQLSPEDRRFMVAVLCRVELVRHQLGAPQDDDAAINRVMAAL